MVGVFKTRACACLIVSFFMFRHIFLKDIFGDVHSVNVIAATFCKNSEKIQCINVLNVNRIMQCFCMLYLLFDAFLSVVCVWFLKET